MSALMERANTTPRRTTPKPGKVRVASQVGADQTQAARRMTGQFNAEAELAQFESQQEELGAVRSAGAAFFALTRKPAQN